MRMLFVVAAAAVTMGCTNIKYIGESYPPTDHVDVFFSEDDIEREYKVMGHVDATAGTFVSVEKMFEDLKNKAMEKGADGIVVLGLDENVVSESTTYEGTTKQEGKKTTESGKTTTSTTKESEIRALFIKYKTASPAKTESS